jgi:hypothetical protein
MQLLCANSVVQISQNAMALALALARRTPGAPQPVTQLQPRRTARHGRARNRDPLAPNSIRPPTARLPPNRCAAHTEPFSFVDVTYAAHDARGTVDVDVWRGAGITSTDVTSWHWHWHWHWRWHWHWNVITAQRPTQPANRQPPPSSRHPRSAARGPRTAVCGRALGGLRWALGGFRARHGTVAASPIAT